MRDASETDTQANEEEVSPDAGETQNSDSETSTQEGIPEREGGTDEQVKTDAESGTTQ